MPRFPRFLEFLLKLLLQTAIVMLLYFIFIQVYFKKYLFDQRTTDYLADQGIRTSSFSGLVGGLKYQAAELQKKLERQQQDIDQLLEHGTGSADTPRDRYIYSVR